MTSCSPPPPQILILLSYLIATGFTDVYHVGVDTIYISACEYRKTVWLDYELIIESVH